MSVFECDLKRTKRSSCNNEMEAALGTTSETQCLLSESGSTEGCSSCFGRTLNDTQKWGKEKVYSN